MHTLNQLRSGALAGITRLDLSANLSTLPPEVWALADSLEVLNLSGNQLRSLPAELPRLHRLRVIFCSDNPFTELPEVLGDCPSLEVVGFKACQIRQVPATALPPRLRWLILTDNQVSQLPTSLGERPALQKLMLAGNALASLPESLAQSSRLELLRLAANRLDGLPGWLTELPRLAWLALAGNPLGWPRAPLPPLPHRDWSALQLGALLGEGASGRIHALADRPAEVLKLFRAAMTSDGSPEHERLASQQAGQHPALCTPLATLAGHPQGLDGLLLPRLPEGWAALAGPPSLSSCSRDVYPPGWQLPASAALRLAHTATDALAHLHRQGLTHGDLYAHNLLCAPDFSAAVLSDFGAATAVPSDATGRALQALELCALGVLLGELAAGLGDEPANGLAEGVSDAAVDASVDAGADHRTAAPGGHTARALARQTLQSWAQALQVPLPAQRPAAADVAADLAAQSAT